MGIQFCVLKKFDMFANTSIRGFQSICNIPKINNYFVAISFWLIALPTRYTKLKCPTNINDSTVCELSSLCYREKGSLLSCDRYRDMVKLVTVTGDSLDTHAARVAHLATPVNVYILQREYHSYTSNNTRLVRP